MTKKSSKKEKIVVNYRYNCFKRIEKVKAILKSGHTFWSERRIDEWLMSEQSYFDLR